MSTSSQTVESLERPENLVNRTSVPFNIICRFFDALRAQPNMKNDLLEKMFAVCIRIKPIYSILTLKSVGIHQLFRLNAGPDLYPIIRLLLPEVSLLKLPSTL